MSLFLNAVLLGISLCADCFAVSLCASVAAAEKRSARQVWGIALVFAAVQTGLFLVGWGCIYALDSFFVGRLGYIEQVEGILAFLLLLWVGGSMIRDALRPGETPLDLRGFWPVVLGGVATSLDAFSVGMSYALNLTGWPETWPVAVSIAVFTVLSVLLGMFFGRLIGLRFGRGARICGGVILILLGLEMLLR